MTLGEMLEKTGVVVSGVNLKVDEYVSKDQKHYWSLHLLVDDQVLKIGIPETFDRQKIQRGAMGTYPCQIKTFKDGSTKMVLAG